MNSTSGANPTSCSARIRSAAKMKLPLSTAITSSCSGAAALISTASALLRVAIASASNKTRIRVSSDGKRASQSGHGIAPVEKAHDDIAAVGRRRGEARTERQPVARAERRLRRQRGPGIDLVADAVAQGEAKPRHFERARRQVHDCSLDDEHRHSVMDLRGAPDILEIE